MAAAQFAVELTAIAEHDLEEILAYLAENRSAGEAEKLLDAFEQSIGSLENFPLHGAIPKEFEALGLREFRQILLGPYRLIYRIIAAKVFILVIADGRRDLQASLERRLLWR